MTDEKDMTKLQLEIGGSFFELIEFSLTRKVRGQTIRTVVANTAVLEKRKDVIERFMKAYRETIDYMYSNNPQVIVALIRTTTS